MITKIVTDLLANPALEEELIKAGLEIKREAFLAAKDFLKEILRPNLDLENILDMYSPKLDDIIRDCQRQGLKYAAGKFRILRVREKEFAVSFEMYFKDKDDKWQKVSNMSETQDASCLTEEAWKTLQERRILDWPIEAPVPESNRLI